MMVSPDAVRDFGLGTARTRPQPRQPRPDLESMTVAQLRSYAADQHINLTGADRKNDIIAAITRAAGTG